MITQVLTESQEALAAEAAAALAELAAALGELGEEVGAARAAAAAGSLDELFSVVLAGAQGAALEALAGALAGGPAGGMPRRLRIETRPPGGTAAGSGAADLALFLTAAHRPLAPEEHPLLQAASDGSERLLVVVDEAEMLRLSEDVERMEEAVEVTAERIVGARPWVRAVSLAGYAGGPPAPESLVPALAARMVGIFRTPAVLRPKLLRPIDTGLEVARGRLQAVDEALAALGDDLANLEAVEAEMGRFSREAEAALREAETEAGEAVSAFEERAGRLVRRGTRPFLPARRLEERFDREATAVLRDRLREVAAGLQERIAAAAGAARRATEDRVAASPTERTRAHPRGTGAPEAAADVGDDPVMAELERSWHGRPDREHGRRTAASLRQGSLLALALLVLGLAFAAVPFLWGLERGVGVLPLALGGGLGGASILAALAALSLRRRRVTEELAGHAHDLRAGAAAALAAGAEGAAEAGRAALLAPVERYVAAVAVERDRLTVGRGTLEGLRGRLEDLRRRASRA